VKGGDEVGRGGGQRVRQQEGESHQELGSGHWILSLRKGKESRARGSRDVPLSLTWPHRVGVCGRRGGSGLLYDADAADLLVSCSDCHFTERLFNPVEPFELCPSDPFSCRSH